MRIRSLYDLRSQIRAEQRRLRLKRCIRMGVILVTLVGVFLLGVAVGNTTNYEESVEHSSITATEGTGK